MEYFMFTKHNTKNHGHDKNVQFLVIYLLSICSTWNSTIFQKLSKKSCTLTRCQNFWWLRNSYSWNHISKSQWFTSDYDCVLSKFSIFPSGKLVQNHIRNIRNHLKPLKTTEKALKYLKIAQFHLRNQFDPHKHRTEIPHLSGTVDWTWDFPRIFMRFMIVFFFFQ